MEAIERDRVHLDKLELRNSSYDVDVARRKNIIRSIVWRCEVTSRSRDAGCT